MLLEWRAYDRSQDEKSRANDAAVGVGDTEQHEEEQVKDRIKDSMAVFRLFDGGFSAIIYFLQHSSANRVERVRMNALTKDRLKITRERNPDSLAVRR